MLHPDGSLKGYGFVEYSNREATLSAIEHLNNRTFRGRQLVVKMTKPAGDGARRMPTIHTSSPHGRRVTYGMSDTNLYIGGLPEDITEQELRSLFSAYGEVEDVRRFVDRSTRRILGTACVRMSNAEDAAAALQGMNKASVKGKIIYCKYALDKSKKLAFHKAPPDKKLRERFFPARRNDQNGTPSNIQSLVHEAVKKVFQNPQIAHLLPNTNYNGAQPRYGMSGGYTTTNATPWFRTQTHHNHIVSNIQQQLAAQQEAAKNRAFQTQRTEQPQQVQVQPLHIQPQVRQEQAYNPLRDSTISRALQNKPRYTATYHPYRG